MSPAENMKNCSEFSSCSCNICPLDLNAKERFSIKEDEKCWFVSNSKGNRRTITDKLLPFVPKCNYKFLNLRSKSKIEKLSH
jgi:hypothetical protein